MIKVSELRKGNLILLDTGIAPPSIHVIKGQDIADLENGKITLASLSGIPLTSEWLERCGFEKDKEQRMGTDHVTYSLKLSVTGANRNEIIAIVRTQEKYRNTAYYAVNDAWGSNDIYFVHQLQNLYFTLTGEELNVKL